MDIGDTRLVRRIERRVQRLIVDWRLFPGEGPVILAVSGGPDSLALLHIIARVAGALAAQPIAAYIDHGIRDARVIEDERRFVAAQAAALGLAFVSACIEQGEVSGRRSPEEAAREGRYRALARVAAAVGAASVATGHTRTDQAETVLGRMLRGSGLRGLAAMAPSTEWPAPPGDRPRLVRPLLTTSRHETLAYCRARGLTPRIDSENANPRYQRNQLRTELLPALRRFNPRVEDALVHLADEARLVRERPSVAPSPSGDRSVVLDVRALRGVDTAARLGVLRAALVTVLPEGWGPSRAHLLSVERLALGPRGRAVSLPGGAIAWREADTLVLAAEDERAMMALVEDLPLPVPGMLELDGWRISAQLVESSDADPAEDATGAMWWTRLDPAAGAGLIVGPRRPGDRIQLTGMVGRRRLQDLFVDAGVARWRRAAWPVVRTEGGVLWVPGLSRVASWAAATGARSVVLIAERRSSEETTEGLRPSAPQHSTTGTD